MKCPSRLLKTRGWACVPVFVYYKSVANLGDTNNQYLAIRNIFPTFLDLAGAVRPVDDNPESEMLPLQGSSFTGLIEGDLEPVHKAGEVIGSGLHGSKALVQGDRKA